MKCKHALARERMKTRILGFKEKDAEVKLKKTMTSGCCCDYLVDGFKLVPVVSVAWLEAWCKNQKQAMKSTTGLDEFDRGIECILEILLNSVHLKAAGKK